MNYDPSLDPGIEPYVEALNSAGVETFESCEGGMDTPTQPQRCVFMGGCGVAYPIGGPRLRAAHKRSSEDMAYH